MLMSGRKLSDQELALVRLYGKLDSARQVALLEYAEFLAQRVVVQSKVEPKQPPQVPRAIPRPEQESVVAAIKRLSASYQMLESADLLTETSTLMTAHVLKGESAAQVIDQLEALFERHYKTYLDSEAGNNAD